MKSPTGSFENYLNQYYNLVTVVEYLIEYRETIINLCCESRQNAGYSVRAFGTGDAGSSPVKTGHIPRWTKWQSRLTLDQELRKDIVGSTPTRGANVLKLLKGFSL